MYRTLDELFNEPRCRCFVQRDGKKKKGAANQSVLQSKIKTTEIPDEFGLILTGHETQPRAQRLFTKDSVPQGYINPSKQHGLPDISMIESLGRWQEGQRSLARSKARKSVRHRTQVAHACLFWGFFPLEKTDTQKFSVSISFNRKYRLMKKAQCWNMLKVKVRC